MHLAGLYNNFGLLFTELEQYDSAYYYYEQALEIQKEIKDKPGIFRTMLGFGLIYSKQEEYDLAQNYYNKTLELAMEMDNNLFKSNAFYSMGITLLERSEYEQAEYYLNKAMDIAGAIQNHTVKMDAAGKLSELYERAGNFEKSLEYYKKYMGLRDSLYSEKASMQLTRFRVQQETLERENKIRMLQKNAEIQQSFIILLIVISVAFIMLAGFLFFMFRLKNKLLAKNRETYEKQKEIDNLAFQKQQAEIEHKKRELISSLIQVGNKNEALQHIKQQLMKIKEETPGTDRRFNSMIRDINSNISLDDDWDQFKIHFEDVHPEFFNRLGEKFPNLTPYEMKLCAYLKINLSTKEISQIMNVTIAAINKSRQRLRKKIGADPEENLTKLMQEV